MINLTEVLPDELEKMIGKDVVLIDIRRQDEWDYTGVIKTAHKMTFFDMFGNADVQAWFHKFTQIAPSKDTQIVLICAHANRTKVVGNFLLENSYTNVGHLSGGMARWLEEGKTVSK